MSFQNLPLRTEPQNNVTENDKEKKYIYKKKVLFLLKMIKVTKVWKINNGVHRYGLIFLEFIP